MEAIFPKSLRLDIGAGILSGVNPPKFLVRSILVAAAVVLLFVLGTRDSYACTCLAPGPPTEELNRSSRVFHGRVIAVYPTKVTYGFEVFRSWVYKFRVLAVWKGPLHEYVYLHTQAAGSTCASGFTAGEEYMVYGSGSLCSRTRGISQAQEDLAELGEGKVPELGTSAPVPRGVIELEKLLKQSPDQVPVPDGNAAAPTVMESTVTVTQAVQTGIPTATPGEPLRAPTPVVSSRTLKPSPLVATPAPAVADKQPSPPWPIVALVALLAAALIGSMAHGRVRRSRRSGE